MPADPAVAAMYERLRKGGGIGVQGGLNSVGLGHLSPAISRSMADAARIQGATGLTDYNLALSPINAALFTRSQQANRNAYLNDLSMRQSQNNVGLSAVMQLLAPFLGGMMGSVQGG